MLLAFVTFLTMIAGLGALAWLFGRRLVAHAKKNPEAVKAWAEHVLRPMLTPEEEKPE